MITKLNKHILSNEKSELYFKEYIDWKSISLSILKEINFNDGVFFTLLPANARIERLYDLESGIHPTNPRIDNYEPVTRLSKELSDFIHNFLSESNQKHIRLAIVEHAYGEKSNRHVLIENVNIKYVGEKEVYYFLDSENSIDQIRQVISASDCAVWHFLAILTEDLILPENIEGNYEEICKNIRYIITTAYDGEGYLFWERNKIS